MILVDILILWILIYCNLIIINYTPVITNNVKAMICNALITITTFLFVSAFCIKLFPHTHLINIIK